MIMIKTSTCIGLFDFFCKRNQDVKYLCGLFNVVIKIMTNHSTDDDDYLRRRLLWGLSAGTTGWCQGSGRAPQWAGKRRIMMMMIRGERIIRYSNSWDRIVIFVFVFGRYFQTEYFLYLYSDDFSKPNTIRIRIRMIFQTRIVFVFVFGWSLKTE